MILGRAGTPRSLWSSDRCRASRRGRLAARLSRARWLADRGLSRPSKARWITGLPLGRENPVATASRSRWRRRLTRTGAGLSRSCVAKASSRWVSLAACSQPVNELRGTFAALHEPAEPPLPKARYWLRRSVSMMLLKSSHDAAGGQQTDSLELLGLVEPRLGCRVPRRGVPRLLQRSVLPPHPAKGDEAHDDHRGYPLARRWRRRGKHRPCPLAVILSPWCG